MEVPEEVVKQISSYGHVLANGLYFLVGGVLVIILLHLLANRMIYPRLTNTRLFKVIFMTLYLVVLVVTLLLILERIGIDTTLLGKLAFMAVFVFAVVAFFLLPFVPRLPFKIGEMVDIGGTLGIIDTISPFHTTLRTFDGNSIFIPNALVLASRIVNYHVLPSRRIELNINVNTDSDMDRTRERLTQIMGGDERVHGEPSPVVRIQTATAAGVDITGYCWVDNADWLETRSDLLLKVIAAAQQEQGISLSYNAQEVMLSGEVHAHVAAAPANENT